MLIFAYPKRSDLKEVIREQYLKNPDKFLYYGGSCFLDYDNPTDLEVNDKDWSTLEMISYNEKEEKILGYFKATYDLYAGMIDNVAMISLTEKTTFEFKKDLNDFLFRLYNDQRFNKINWVVYSGNKTEKMYDRVCQKYGGRIVGTYIKNYRLKNGVWVDEKFYEIFTPRGKKLLDAGLL